MKQLLLSFLIFGISSVYSQVLRVSCLNQFQESVDNVEFWKGNEQLPVFEGDSYYEFQIKSQEKITLKHTWYMDTTFQVVEKLNSNDTVLITIYLKPIHTKNIDEVIISSKKYQLVYKERNEFIIDYFPMPKSKLLLLTKIGKNRFLKLLDENDSLEQKISLSINPTELFLDALGNFHVLTKDSVYQIWLTDSEFKLMKPYPYLEFQKNISNMIAVESDNIFYKNMTKHNQSFVIDVFNKTNGRKMVYNSFDEIKFKSAVEHYNEIVYTYHSVTPDYLNIIKLGLWDGNISKLGETSGLLQKIVWYKNIIARPINVYAYGMLNGIVVVDGFKKELSVINYQDFSTYSITTKFDCSGNFYYDYFFDELYTYTKKGSISVNKIDVKTGELTSSVELSDILLPRNIKISNGWVYFLVLDESGYNRLFKSIR